MMLQFARISETRNAYIAGKIIVSAFIAMAIISLFFTPYNVETINVDARLSAPSATHWFGTNHFGRDVFSMIMVGARASIMVAVLAVVGGMMIGVPLGLVAAGNKGFLDEILMRTSDIIFAFPALILAILITAVYGPGVMSAVIAIGVFNIPVFARLTRGAALPIWTRGYVMSARTAGKNSLQISIAHILPNIAPTLIVQGTVQFSLAVLAESALSYVGLGVQPPAPSWGRMLAESQTMIGFAPWLAIFPGLAIFLFVLGLNLIGDGLRKHLDPHHIKGTL
ncbi:ABC transporter permease [Hyphococcus sp.]|uniref:ABC transporter permease n=1 Tax=Hyphococcus sp. TaxID=2038636 RepID=UPI003CCBAF60